MKHLRHYAARFATLFAAALLGALVATHIPQASAAYPTGISQILWATRGYYGDLSTGTGGACTVASGTTTMSTDVWCSTMNVSSGATLVTANYVIHADILINNGTISNNGGNAVGGTPVTPASQATLAFGTGGGPGVTNAAGGTGTAGQPTAWQNISGTGGAGGASTNGGGAAGVRNSAAATCGNIRSVAFNGGAITGFCAASPATYYLGGGTGGGSGGSAAGACTSGGGGGGGGPILITARSLQGNGAFSATGGTGGNGAGTTGCGGGGGGGGGVIIITAGDLSQWTGTTAVTGGGGGSFAVAGSNGSGGSAGQAIFLQG